VTSYHVQVEVVLSCKSFPMPRTGCNLAEILGFLVLLSFMALHASSIAKLGSIAGGVLASEWTSVFARVFVHVFALICKRCYLFSYEVCLP